VLAFDACSRYEARSILGQILVAAQGNTHSRGVSVHALLCAQRVYADDALYKRQLLPQPIL
jgi:hypothetical protein